MSNYAETRTKLEARLHDQRGFRDSQPDGSAEWDHFQTEAQQTAQALILLKNNESQLSALDNQVNQRAKAATQAQRRHARRVAPWQRTSVAAGVAAVGMVVTGWALSLTLLVVLGMLAGAGAGLAVFLWLKVDSESRDETRRQAARLKQAQQERREFARKVLPES